MSAAAAGRVGRFYTCARRHPWVLGKVADWRIPLGPYTPAQIIVAVGGGFLLVKTTWLWSWMGPVPIVAWLLAIWTVRRPRIRGRAPLQAALGWVLLGWQPQGGRIGARAARDRAPHPLLGGFTIESTPSPAAAITARRTAVRRPASQKPHRKSSAAGTSVEHRARPADPVTPAVPVSGVQQLLALAEQGGTR
ncbi:hypothetical protein ACH41H_44030 [Streptomyces sp. NPDC020800]|uniref:hypothetical protein n=1 Tax=Streptomyces sp. NPDC020800 TaxID=3365092 RepID=UPI0037AFDA1E